MTTTALRTCPLCEATCGLVLELAAEGMLGVPRDAGDAVPVNLDRPGGAMFPRAWHEDRSGRPAQRFARFHSPVSGHTVPLRYRGHADLALAAFAVRNTLQATVEVTPA